MRAVPPLARYNSIGMPSVQRVRWAKFRVVVTTFVSLLILATLVILLTGGTFFQPKSMLYVYVPDATGIATGSPVRVDGIQVGKVGEVALSGSAEPSRVVRVTLIVDRERLPSITADSTAQAAADTLIGDKFIQISSGNSAQRAQPGMEVPYKVRPTCPRPWTSPSSPGAWSRWTLCSPISRPAAIRLASSS